MNPAPSEERPPAAKKRQLLLRFDTRPLREIMPLELFQNVPRSPGVYLLKDERGRPIYIGQSKSLRARLGYYRNAKPEAVPNRILKLVSRVREIAWIDCATAEEAELCELEQLRIHQPPFNVANAHPQNYPFIRLRADGAAFQLALTRSSEPQSAAEDIYGAFKNRTGARRAILALARVCWCIQNEPSTPHELPAAMLDLPPRSAGGPLPLRRFEPEEFIGGLRLCLLGEDAGVLTALSEALPRRSRFLEQLLETDLLALREFFGSGPQRNRELSRKFGLDRLLRPAELAELRVASRRRPTAP